MKSFTIQVGGYTVKADNVANLQTKYDAIKSAPDAWMMNGMPVCVYVNTFNATKLVRQETFKV